MLRALLCAPPKTSLPLWHAPPKYDEAKESEASTSDEVSILKEVLQSDSDRIRQLDTWYGCLQERKGIANGAFNLAPTSTSASKPKATADSTSVTTTPVTTQEKSGPVVQLNMKVHLGSLGVSRSYVEAEKSKATILVMEACLKHLKSKHGIEEGDDILANICQRKHAEWRVEKMQTMLQDSIKSSNRRVAYAQARYTHTKRLLDATIKERDSKLERAQGKYDRLAADYQTMYKEYERIVKLAQLSWRFSKKPVYRQALGAGTNASNKDLNVTV